MMDTSALEWRGDAAARAYGWILREVLVHEVWLP